MNLPTAPLSVLMSTYEGECAAHLDASLESVIQQTLPAAETVLVLDGPVDRAQEDVIARYADMDGTSLLRIVRTPRQRGLATALNAGLRECSCEFVARMDSDDVCVPDRFELQWRALVDDPAIDLLAAWQVEFDTDEGTMLRLKRTPEHHAEIVRRLKWRCLISHPTIIFRRSLVMGLGGYRSVGFLEDYDLYMRLIDAGARFHAVQKPLVKVRSTHDQHARRGGLRYVRQEWSFRLDCYRRGNLNLPEFLATSLAYTGLRLLPARTRALLYAIVREPVR